MTKKKAAQPGDCAALYPSIKHARSMTSVCCRLPDRAAQAIHLSRIVHAVCGVPICKSRRPLREFAMPAHALHSRTAPFRLFSGTLSRAVHADLIPLKELGGAAADRRPGDPLVRLLIVIKPGKIPTGVKTGLGEGHWSALNCIALHDPTTVERKAAAKSCMRRNRVFNRFIGKRRRISEQVDLIRSIAGTLIDLDRIRVVGAGLRSC